ncbi:MAG: ABC transporter ATP-binding protein [Proteobacteria bacterium]|nr:ABC transporter ATP-binding protein [Pseudomonadota bacterium]MCH9011498.1 ABC transporter ATP-binding protein [Pseudomonadota bacterium]
MTALLEVRDVAVSFGGVRALDGVTFALQVGELLGLIGPNGAGKTTALRAITGTVRPDRGTVTLEGLELTRLPVHRRVRAGLGMSQQLVRPFRAMTAIENVMLAAGTAKTHAPFGALLKRDRGPEREKALAHLETVGIAEAAESAPDSLPLGTLKRLEMARALALEPKVLLLDEPLAGLNHVEARRLADTIVELNRGGVSIVLIEHNLGEVMRVCSRLVVLDNGRVLGDGAPEAVMADPAVRTAYLGAGAGVEAGHA